MPSPFADDFSSSLWSCQFPGLCATEFQKHFLLDAPVHRMTISVAIPIVKLLTSQLWSPTALSCTRDCVSLVCDVSPMSPRLEPEESKRKYQKEIACKPSTKIIYIKWSKHIWTFNLWKVPCFTQIWMTFMNIHVTFWVNHFPAPATPEFQAPVRGPWGGDSAKQLSCGFDNHDISFKRILKLKVLKCLKIRYFRKPKKTSGFSMGQDASAVRDGEDFWVLGKFGEETAQVLKKLAGSQNHHFSWRTLEKFGEIWYTFSHIFAHIDTLLLFVQSHVTALQVNHPKLQWIRSFLAQRLKASRHQPVGFYRKPQTTLAGWSHATNTTALLPWTSTLA